GGARGPPMLLDLWFVYTSTSKMVPIGTPFTIPRFSGCPEPGQVPLSTRTWIASAGGPLNAGASPVPTGATRFSSIGVSQTSHQSVGELRWVETCQLIEEVPALKSARCAGEKKTPP